MIPEGEQKRGFLRMLREKLPELPAWLKYENQVQAARERLENDLIPRIAGSQQERRVVADAAAKVAARLRTVADVSEFFGAVSYYR